MSTAKKTLDAARVIDNLPKVRHRLTDKLARVMTARTRKGLHIDAALTGPAGSGKSYVVKMIAASMGIDFYDIGMTVMPSNLIGYPNPHTGEWVQTPFTRAFINGGAICMEEMDGWSANATLAINGPLANGFITSPTGEKYERHPDCIVVACMNTWGRGATMEYVGRNRLDDAFLDRFPVKLHWDYDHKLEEAVCGDADVAAFVQRCRDNAESAGIKVMITPRASIAIADLIRHGFSLKEAAEMSFLASLDNNQRATVMRDTEEFFEAMADEDYIAVFGNLAKRK